MTAKEMAELLVRMVNRSKKGAPIGVDHEIYHMIEDTCNLIAYVNHTDVYTSVIAGVDLKTVKVISPIAHLFTPKWVSMEGSLDNADLINRDKIEPVALDYEINLNKCFMSAKDLSTWLRTNLTSLKDVPDISIYDARGEVDFSDKKHKDKWAYNGLVYSPEITYWEGMPVELRIPYRRAAVLNCSVSEAVERYIMAMPEWKVYGKKSNGDQSTKPGTANNTRG